MKKFKELFSTKSDQRSNAEVIAEIHEEFNSAGDKLLMEAKEFLASIDAKKQSKINRLREAGFANSIEVRTFNERTAEIDSNKQLAERIEYYAVKYPGYKFITNEIVEKLCKKYGLVCAPISRYKGFVPDEQLKRIEALKIYKEDKAEIVYFITKWRNPASDKSQIEDIIKEYPNGVPAKLVTETSTKDAYIHLPGHSSVYFTHADKENADERMICASPKDIDLKGLKKVGAYMSSFTSKTYPDPVVLDRVVGGAIIGGAWGEEASDEMVVNHNNN